MQRRERLLAIIVAALVTVWCIDSVLIAPLSEWYANCSAEIERYEQDINEAQILIDRQKRIMDAWRGQHAAGLLKDEQSARFDLQDFVVKAAAAATVQIDSIGAQSAAVGVADDTFWALGLSLTAQGNLQQVQNFVQRLELAPVPLRIERCEVASHDAKKDHLQLSVALSTLIVAEQLHAGRSLPADSQAWQAAGWPDTIAQSIIALKPFLADRRQTPVVVTKKTEPTEKPVVTATPVDPGTWVLVGVVTSEKTQAFFRHNKTGVEKNIGIGEEIDAYRFDAVEDHVLIVSSLNAAAEASAGEREEKRIPIGYSLLGKQSAAPLPARSSSVSSSGSSSSASSSSAASSISDEQRQAILERLRQRRGRKE